MLRLSRLGILALLCFLLPLALSAEDKKKFNGVHGKVKTVDVDESTLTITTDEGKARTFKVSDDTQIVGLRGDAVPQRLKDKRFHAGREITVIPAGDSQPAAALLLGYDRKASITRTLKRRRVNRDTEDAGTGPTSSAYAKLLVGKWEVTKGDGSLRVGVVCEFRKDGTMKISNWEPSVRGADYKVEGDKILITLKLYGRGAEKKEPATIKGLSEKELLLTFEPDGTVYELKRVK